MDFVDDDDDAGERRERERQGKSADLIIAAAKNWNAEEGLCCSIADAAGAETVEKYEQASPAHINKVSRKVPSSYFTGPAVVAQGVSCVDDVILHCQEEERQARCGGKVNLCCV